MTALLLLFVTVVLPVSTQFENLKQTHDSNGSTGTNQNRWVCYVQLDQKVQREDRFCGKKINMTVCGADDIRCEWNRETLRCVGKTQARCQRQGHAYCHTYRFSMEKFSGKTPADGRRYRCDGSQPGEPLVPLKWK